MKTLPNLPVGVQTFQDIRHGGYVYVDKTQYLYQLASAYRGAYFLSRPRRFGKSLTISTLDCMFQGKKDLFNGLWIENSDWTWETSPVIRLDMAQQDLSSPGKLEQSIYLRLSAIASDHGVTIDATRSPKEQFQQLIELLAKEKPVVVLIDEYDKPIIEYIEDLERAKPFREFMKGFYGCLKSQGHNIRFLLLTGVSKFSKVSVFSELNHLSDLTMSNDSAALVGYTQEELEHSFSGWIDHTAQNLNLSKSQLLAQIKHWYNGYRFSRTQTKVYNPFSTLRFFKEQEFSNFWFESGTPSFLPKLMKAQNYDGGSLENTLLDEAGFTAFEIDNLEISALLFQTGYITIKDYFPEDFLFRLGYPNFEVEHSFTKHLASIYSGVNPGEIPKLSKLLLQALNQEDWNRFEEILRSFFASIPYELHKNATEAYYHTLFYVVFKMMGTQIQAEELVNLGRIDAVLELKDKVYIFEFKLDDSADAAIAQIKKKKYADAYLASGKKIMLVGLAFSRELRNLKEWKRELFQNV